MRTITNIHGLPEALVTAVTVDTHWQPSNANVSVTGLIDAPQVRILKKKANIKEDVSEMMWALLGQAMHAILERSQIHSLKRRSFMEVARTLYELSLKEEDEKERVSLDNASKWLFKIMDKYFPELADRYLFEFNMTYEHDGYIISGTCDLYDKVTCFVEDYKVCSVYQYMNPDAQNKWKRQLNIYAHMLRALGYEVKGLEIIAMFRDWSSARKESNSQYPDRHVMRIPQQLYPPEVVHEYISKRVELHRQADMGNVVDCTGEERWATSTTFAARVPTSSKAVKVLGDDRHTAEMWVEENKHKRPGLYLEVRAGSNRKCEEYCTVRDICPQRKRMTEELLK